MNLPYSVTDRSQADWIDESNDPSQPVSIRHSLHSGPSSHCDHRDARRRVGPTHRIFRTFYITASSHHHAPLAQAMRLQFASIARHGRTLFTW